MTMYNRRLAGSMSSRSSTVLPSGFRWQNKKNKKRRVAKKGKSARFSDLAGPNVNSSRVPLPGKDNWLSARLSL